MCLAYSLSETTQSLPELLWFQRPPEGTKSTDVHVSSMILPMNSSHTASNTLNHMGWAVVIVDLTKSKFTRKREPQLKDGPTRLACGHVYEELLFDVEGSSPL